MKLPDFLKRPTTSQLFAIFAVLLLFVVLVFPPNPVTMARYQLNGTSYRILLLATTVVPSLLTWAAAFYGYEQLRIYTKLIQKTPEGEAFHHLTKGSRWVALYLPIVTIIALFLGGIANHFHAFRGTSLVLTSYTAILVALVAFHHVSVGARIMANNANVRPTLFRTRLLTVTFIAMGVIYCYFIIRNSLINPHGNPYYLPLGWMLITVVVPYFFAWMMGLLAVLDIDAYAANVQGVLYRKALRHLSGGLLAIISSSILLQYVNSANTERGRLVLGGVLLVRYALYIGMAAGFALVGSSAKKLQQIEKI